MKLTLDSLIVEFAIQLESTWLVWRPFKIWAIRRRVSLLVSLSLLHVCVCVTVSVLTHRQHAARRLFLDNLPITAYNIHSRESWFVCHCCFLFSSLRPDSFVFFFAFPDHSLLGTAQCPALTTQNFDYQSVFFASSGNQLLDCRNSLLPSCRSFASFVSQNSSAWTSEDVSEPLLAMK